ncbi:hypothetical protein ACQEVB_08170 [Pseudonocardia sp. CA-107938]|uniref:hypothetical protein n=1 Tax=Pseudonocardia sp. CA-107938 TaxID=3240021 RepID=UPI003D94A066
MSSDVTYDDPDAPTGPQDTVSDEPTGPQPVVPPDRPRTAGGLLGAVISAIITGGVAELLSYPATCDATFAPFMSDCRNLMGWSSFADYPGSAAMIAAVAAVFAGLLVYLMVRFSDS